MHFKNYLLLLGIIFLAILSFSLISENGESRLAVWDGESSSALASNATNWDSDIAPVAGDNILFDGLNATGDDACTWDLATNSFGTFTIGSGYSGTITQSSDMYISGYSHAGGTFTGDTTKWVYCNGNFTNSGGTITSNKLMLNIIGNCYYSSSHIIRQFVLDSNCTLNSNLLSYSIIINNNIICGNYKIILYAGYSVGITNSYISGIISGNNIETCFLDVVLSSSDANIYVNGSINILTKIRGAGDSSANRNLYLQTDCIITSVSIYSEHTSRTCTLNLNGHSLTATSITIGTRGILKCGSGSIYTNSLTSTLGTIIPETSTFIIEENGNINIGATNYLYNLNVKNTINFASDCNITNNLIFRENLINRDYGLYFDTVRQYTVTSNSNGLIIEDAFIINSTEISIFLKPLIILSYINIEDNTIAINDFYHVEYISDIPVNWTFNSTANWISFENGNISGIANVTDTFYYTITATSIDGEVTTYTSYIYVASVYDLQMFTFIIIIWIILMIVFLLISLKYNEWGILGGIIWLLAGLLEFLDLNTTLGLIIISIGMFIMLYGILELMKR